MFGSLMNYFLPNQDRMPYSPLTKLILKKQTCKVANTSRTLSKYICIYTYTSTKQILQQTQKTHKLKMFYRVSLKLRP